MSGDSRYILSKKVARGGMAEIWMAKQIGEDGFHRLCCVKRILSHYANDKEFVEMFRDEARICQRLQHANVVRVEDFQEVEGSWAIIMEFVNGPDLRSLLSACEKASIQEKRRIRLGVPLALFIAAETGKGLHYAHSKVDEITNRQLGIVHRDISPQNILVSYQGEVKVTDFGIANAESRITETKPGVVKGKYAYMSPEQISAKPVDQRTDVFALGIVLWEMLAMERLFFGENEVATIQMVKACRINRDLRKLNPAVEEELYQIIMKALKKDFRERYQTCEQFEKELRRYQNKHFPEFSAKDLSIFVSEVLAQKKAESAENIKSTLTNTDQRPKTTSKSNSKNSKPSEASLMQEFDLGNNKPSIAIKGMATKSNRYVPQATMHHHTTRARSSAGYGAKVRSSSSNGFQKKSAFSGSTVAILGLVGAIIAAVAIYFNLSPQEPLSAKVILSTTPKVVKLSWNGTPLNKGAYKTTPTSLENIQPGLYRVTISRAGFKTATVDLDLSKDAFLRKDIVLERIQPMVPTMIKFEGPQPKKPVEFSVADGLATGQVPGPASFLPAGRRYQVRFSGQGGFSCQFNPKATSWTNPFILMVNHQRKRCRPVYPR